MKKIGLIAILVIIVVCIVLVFNNASSGRKENKVANTATIEKNAQTKNVVANETVSNVKKTKVTKLENGVRYSLNDEIKTEIVIGDNFYGTQISDINMNFNNYEGKIIEIEGLYFENDMYTFVGRYATSAVCPTCPPGFVYFEYEWKGDEKIKLTDSEDWIKVIGTLRKGFDGEEYYYIDVISLDVLNEKGIDTVSN